MDDDVAVILWRNPARHVSGNEGRIMETRVGIWTRVDLVRIWTQVELS